MSFIASFLIAMVIGVTLIPLLRKWALPLGLVDQPNERKVHDVTVPRIGGIAIVLGALVPILIWAHLTQEIQAYLLGSLVILAFGIWDDRKELNYRLKLLGQIVAVAVVIIYGKITIQWLPFQGLDTAPIWLSIFLTFVALLGITNAVNLVDGLDGLAGGTSLLSLGAIGLLALLSGDTSLVVITVAICGSIFGFLRFNTHPASIFMGDTGSQFLGFSIGVSAVILTQSSNTALSPVVPLIILGLPILDTLTVMIRRIIDRRSPFSPDKGHFHHRLMALGLLHYEAVIFIYLVQIGLILSGFILRYQSDWVLLSIFITFCFGFNGLLYWAEKSKWSYEQSSLGSLLRPNANWSRLGNWRALIVGLTRPLILFSLPAYLMLSYVQASEIEGVSLLFLLMLLACLVFMASNGRYEQSSWPRAIWYGACGLGVYCASETGFNGALGAKIYLAILAFTVILVFQYREEASFKVNPLDVIVLFLAAIMPNLSNLDPSFSNIGGQFTQIVIFLYSVEVMLDSSPGMMRKSYALLSIAFALGFLCSILA